MNSTAIFMSRPSSTTTQFIAKYNPEFSLKRCHDIVMMRIARRSCFMINLRKSWKVFVSSFILRFVTHAYLVLIDLLLKNRKLIVNEAI